MRTYGYDNTMNSRTRAQGLSRPTASTPPLPQASSQGSYEVQGMRESSSINVESSLGSSRRGSPIARITDSSKAPKSRRVYQIYVSQLFDSVRREMVQKQVIWVDRDKGLILDVCDWEEADTWTGSLYNQDIEAEVTKIDLRGLTVLPGLVDVHVHFFLHPYSETSWEDQVTKESLAERTIRATVHARKTLMAGFTTVRDLGTEGGFDADIALRKSLSEVSKMPGYEVSRTMIPGPRYYCANRAIVSSGAYGPKSSIYPYQEGINDVRGAEPVDGIDQGIKEVRKQIGAGADWIKIYADYLCRSRISSVSPSVGLRSIALFNKDELAAMISTAHARGVKVAAHANTPKAIGILMDLDVDTIEHGGEMYDSETGDRAILRRLAKAGSPGGSGREGGRGGGTTWVPTLAAYYTSSLDGSKFGKKRWERCKRTFEQAIRMGSAATRGVNLASSSSSSRSAYTFSSDKTKGKEDDKEKDKDLDFLWNEEPMENIACGGDTGVFSHGKNALELVLMRNLGASWERVLGWATLGGWRCVRGMEWEGEDGIMRVRSSEKRAQSLMGRSGSTLGLGDLRLDVDGEDDEEEDDEEELGLDRDVPFGVIRGGWAADLVAVQGTLDGSPADFEAALTDGVKFVMKAGFVYKIGGVEVVS